MKATELYDDIRKYCLAHADKARSEKYARYFKEGYDAYGLSQEAFTSKVSSLANDENITMRLVLSAGRLLVKSGKYEETNFAIYLLKEFSDQFSAETLTAIEKWFQMGIVNWAHCDILCGHLITPLFDKKIISIDYLSGWRTAKNKYQRRAVPVAMLTLLKTTKNFKPLFTFIEPFMMDSEHKVQQGLGWFLREAWKVKREQTEDFLLKWKNKAPRTIFQYATEKMTAEERKRFKKIKKMQDRDNKMIHIETDPQVIKKLQWWQQLKFGMMIHWGIYSTWGAVESWPIVDKEPYGRDSLPQWEQAGKDPDRFMQMYFALNRQFNPGQFAPESWAEAAKEAGMKYLVFSSKHHDGFSMFDTAGTDYRVTHSSCPFSANMRADITREVLRAFGKKGFGIGVYFSKADWHNEDYWSPDRPRRSREVNYNTQKNPQKWSRYVNFVHSQLRELLTGYGPVDILWLDSDWVRPPMEDINMPAIAAMGRSHNPGLLIVDRNIGGRYENYTTPEQKVPQQSLDYPWETCMTMAQQWSYNPLDRYKSTGELIHLLIDVVCKGGNFLLNVGPAPDGTLPASALERLKEIGEWMTINGAGIYSTSPAAPYKQDNICFTRKGKTLYMFYLAGREDENLPAEFSVPAVTCAETVRMLGTKQPVGFSNTGSGLSVRIPASIQKSPPCKYAWCFEIKV